MSEDFFNTSIGFCNKNHTPICWSFLNTEKCPLCKAAKEIHNSKIQVKALQHKLDETKKNLIRKICSNPKTKNIKLDI